MGETNLERLEVIENELLLRQILEKTLRCNLVWSRIHLTQYYCTFSNYELYIGRVNVNAVYQLDVLVDGQPEMTVRSDIEPLVSNLYNTIEELTLQPNNFENEILAIARGNYKGCIREFDLYMQGGVSVGAHMSMSTAVSMQGGAGITGTAVLTAGVLASGGVNLVGTALFAGGSDPPIVMSGGLRTGGAADRGNVVNLEMRGRVRIGRKDLSIPGVDIAILIDSTASMAGYFPDLKEAIKQFAWDVYGPDTRWGIADYKDFEEPGYHLGVQVKQKLTNDLLVFEDSLDALSASGSGDVPEQAFAALNYLPNNWASLFGIPSTSGRTQVIVWAGDAPSWNGSVKSYIYPAITTVQLTLGVIVSNMIILNMLGPGDGVDGGAANDNLPYQASELLSAVGRGCLIHNALGYSIQDLKTLMIDGLLDTG